MVATSAAVNATELAALGLDKPCMLAQNLLDNWSTAGWFTGTYPGPYTAADDSSYPVRALRDRSMRHITRPALQSPTVNIYQLRFDFGVLVSFDSFALLGHNVAEMSGTNITMNLQVSDNGNYDMGDTIKTIWTASFTGATKINKRKGALNLVDGASENRVWTAQYVQLEIQTDSTFTAAGIPEIGDLWLGQRLQLPYKSDEGGFDDYAYRSNGELSEFRSGATQLYKASIGQIVRQLRFLQVTSLDAVAGGTIDGLSKFRKLGYQTNFSSIPFLYWEDPSTYGDQALLVRKPQALAIPVQEVEIRNLTIDLTEEPAFYFAENPTEFPGA